MAKWEQTSRWGIQKGGGRSGVIKAPYAAGKVDCILQLPLADPPTLLAGCGESGVWVIDKTGGAARSLSFKWTNPSVVCLASGPRGSLHVYAGGSALMETDFASSDPLSNWSSIPINVKDSSGTPVSAGNINDIAVVANHLVLACDGGMVVAEIPALGTSYKFGFASPDSGPVPRTKFSSVTECGQSSTASSVVFAQWGNGSAGSGGIWIGIPSLILHHGIGLVAARANMPKFLDTAGTIPFATDAMFRTSLRCCAGHRETIFAVAADANAHIFCVLKGISDGGLALNFQITGNAITNLPPDATGPLVLFNGNSDGATGNQGEYNQAIAVSQTSHDVVAVAWRDGYFISNDAGSHWARIPVDNDLQLHSDFHALLFDQFDTTQSTIYAGNDGGINFTTDKGATTSTLGNRRLPNLLFTKMALSNNLGNVSNPSVCAGSLQDNGDVATSFDPIDARPFRVTVQAEDFEADGRLVVALPNGRLLNAYADNAAMSDFQWNDQTSIFDPRTPLVVPMDQPDPQGILATTGLQVAGGGNQSLVYGKLVLPISSIITSRYQNPAGEDMIAIGAYNNNLSASLPGNWIYGMFLKMDSTAPTNAGHWTALNSIPLGTTEIIWAVGAFDANHFFVGTSDTSTGRGQIWELRSQATLPWNSRLVRNVTPSTPPTFPGIVQFAADPKHAYAITSGPFIFRMTLNADAFPVWTQIANPSGFNAKGSSFNGYTAITVDLNSNTLFVAADTDVFASTDTGDSWTTLSGPSTGLPAWPRCTDLAVVNEDAGADYLYLATYGWSIWRLLINDPQIAPTDVEFEGTMFFNVGHPGGDDNANPLLLPRMVTLDATHPYAEHEVVNQLFDLNCQLLVSFRLRAGGHVQVDYRVNFRSGDGLDARKNSFVLVPGSAATKHTRGEWSGSSSDAMSVDFDVSI